MNSADSIKHTDEKEYTSKGGKTLYGGGGITPDVFVGYDTAAFDKPLMKALLTGTLARFVYINYLRHQSEFKSYSSPEVFNKKYEAGLATLNDLQQFAQKDSIHFNLDNKVERAHLSKQIKVLTARQIWRTEGFYEINNSTDEMIKKSLVLMNPTFDSTSKGARPVL